MGRSRHDGAALCPDRHHTPGFEEPRPEPRVGILGRDEQRGQLDCRAHRQIRSVSTTRLLEESRVCCIFIISILRLKQNEKRSSFLFRYFSTLVEEYY